MRERWLVALKRAILAALLVLILTHVPLPAQTPGWVAFAQPFPNNRSHMELILPASWVGVASALARHALSRRSCGCNELWGSPGHTIWVCRLPRVRRRPPRRTGPTAYWLDGD